LKKGTAEKKSKKKKLIGAEREKVGPTIPFIFTTSSAIS